MALSWMMYVRNYRSFQHAKPVQILKERLVDPLASRAAGSSRAALSNARWSMNKYGKVAVSATSLLVSAAVTDPREAWDVAERTILTYSKHCPRSA